MSEQQIPDGGGTPTGEDEQDPKTTPEGGDGGDGGDGEDKSPLEKALHAERQQNKALRQQLKEREDREEQARLAAMSEQERRIEEARKQAREEALAESRSDRMRARVTAAAAAARFADPKDAIGFLDLSEVDDTEEAIEEAIADLAKRKPYLLEQRRGGGLEQGPQGKQPAAGGDWLRAAIQG